jgi:sugar/nucleoside kinase (ribokinase family)
MPWATPWWTWNTRSAKPTSKHLNIDKGVMTLVDEAHQLRIMDHLRERYHHRGSGGSAANSVIALAQFGGSGYYACKVADDELGHFYMKDLKTGGVATLDTASWKRATPAAAWCW